MWPGPYGEGGGTRKYVLASLDQSLARMGLEYVDIFYSHRFDPDTPLEETIGALDTAVRQGKALYAGISSYSPEKTREAAAIGRSLGTPITIHQPSYSMLNRWIEPELLDTLGDGRDRLHRLLAARAGRPHRPLPRRDPGGVACGHRGHRALARPAERADAGEGARAERDRGRPGPDARRDGARLDAARPADDLDPRRRLERRAARGERRRARQPRLLGRGAGGDRPATRPRATSTSGRRRARASYCSRGPSSPFSASRSRRKRVSSAASESPDGRSSCSSRSSSSVRRSSSAT